MKRIVAWAAVAAISGTGCLAPRPDRPETRYALEPAPALEAGPTTAWTLGYRPFETAAPYGTPIHRRAGQLRLEVVPGTAWAAPPAATALRAIATGLRQSNAFRDVGPAAELISPDWVLTGRLERFEARDGKARVSLALAVRASDLGDAAERAGGRPLYRGTVRETARIEEPGPAGIARAMTAALGQAAERAARAIAEAARDAS